MTKVEFLSTKSTPPFMGLLVRNVEFIILLGAAMISLILLQVTPIGWAILSLFTLIILFIGKKRGEFIDGGLIYNIYKDKIELYRGGELYRKYHLAEAEVSVERTLFGDNIVLRKSIKDYFGSDSAFGFANDLGRNSYELVIYNCPNVDEVVEYIKEK